MAYEHIDSSACPDGCCIIGFDPDFQPTAPKTVHVRPMFEVTDDSGGETSWVDGGRIGDLPIWRYNW